jgi:hypothetical protein
LRETAVPLHLGSCARASFVHVVHADPLPASPLLTSHLSTLTSSFTRIPHTDI